MEREFEVFGAGALGALLKRKARHAPEPGTLCPNCGVELLGFYCHVCGQSTQDQHRSIWHLIWEGIEGLTHLDGRLGQTLPPLLFNPGKLARDHLEGRRARHVPPFRLFLISLLIFMFVLEAFFHGVTRDIQTLKPGQTLTIQNGRHTNNVVFATPDQVKAMMAAENAKDAAAKASPKPPKAVPATSAHDSTVTPSNSTQVKTATFKANGKDSDVSSAAAALDEAGKGPKSPFGRWLEDRIKRAAANQEYYSMVLFTWAHRLAILLLPILAALLALVYVRRRKQFYIYDHLIVAMQFLSFEFLIFAIAWVIPDPVRGWALWIATLWTPVNLYMILRGAYGSRVITAGLKTVFLWFSTMLLFGLLMVGLITLALAEM